MSNLVVTDAVLALVAWDAVKLSRDELGQIDQGRVKTLLDAFMQAKQYLDAKQPEPPPQREVQEAAAASAPPPG